MLDNLRLFTADHPTKALSIAWLVIVIVFVVVAHWIIDWDRWAPATLTLSASGVAYVATNRFLTKGQQE